jgi:type II secretory pathway pseudopilin PulG
MRRASSGFAYLFLLFALAVLGVLLAALGQNWTTTMQRERETQLLYVGQQFGAALASYRAWTKTGPAAPVTLDQLVEDKRFPFPVRHLRQIYRDPMTGKRDWELQMADGVIVGVRSHSQKIALRQSLPDYVVIAGGASADTSYHDWLFVEPKKIDAGDSAGASQPQASPN